MLLFLLQINLQKKRKKLQIAINFGFIQHLHQVLLLELMKR